MINDSELAAAQEAAAIFQMLGPSSPRDHEIIAKLRTVARLATDSVTTSLSEADRNIIRSETAISIGLVASTWEKHEPLPAEMIDRARKAARAWVEILSYLRS